MKKFVGVAVGFLGGGIASLITVGLIVSIFEMKYQSVLPGALFGASIGGLKVITKSGWFAARPSGTEDLYKIYAESLLGANHLSHILEEAQRIISDALVVSPQQSEIFSKTNLKVNS